MKPPATIWTARPPNNLRAPALLLFLAFAGCHSIQFGPMIHDTNTAAAARVRATLGLPTAASETGPRLAPPEPNPKSEIRNPKQNRNTNEKNGKVPRSDLGNLEYEFVSDFGFRDSDLVIDLATALRRAGADNPTIALAEEAVRARLAERMQARALLFPTLDIGTNLRLHRGNFLTSGGVVTDINIQSLYWGFGADAKGGGTLAVPGLRIVSHLADAVYAPQAAQQKVVQSRFDATATRYYLLMEVGVRYLALVEAQARRQAYQQSRKDFEEIDRITLAQAKLGQGRDADAKRARSETLLLRAQAQSAEEAIVVAAAELARLLDWDPALPMRAADAVPPLLEMVNRDVSLPQLLDSAMAYHPEIVARSADVAYQEIHLRQERLRPFLPVVAVGFSAGDFGGSGPNTASRLDRFHPRTDLDVVAVWSLQNLLVGNRAVQSVARSGLEAAQIERARLLDRIRREVVEGHALVETRRQEMELARKRVETSQRAYAQDLTRAKNPPLGLPIEVLNSASQLAAARQDLIRAIIGYSQAQLQLNAALGNSPQLSAYSSQPEDGRPLAVAGSP
jgi:outer membrane protein TolC